MAMSVNTVLLADGNSVNVVHTASVYGYSGYLTTPHANLRDGDAAFHFSYIPKHATPYFTDSSDTRLYTLTLGFTSWLECYLSVYEATSRFAERKLGTEKTRSPGVKIRILREKTYIPAIACGLFDPKLEDIGTDFSWSTISSSFIVMTKSIGNRGYVSAGYGSDLLTGDISRLNGLFGGASWRIAGPLSVMIDYDGDFLSHGAGIVWRGIDIMVAHHDNKSWLARIGYHYDLHHR